MDHKTFLDRLILWFKNNRFFSVVIFLSIVIVSASKLMDSISTLVEKGRQLTQTSTDGSSERTAATAKAPAFADLVGTFGSAGIGPRMFTDARGIALDGTGNLYISEYERGRIQVLDSRGQFVTEWHTRDRSTETFGITANRQGIIFVALGSWIDRYEGVTGKFLGQIQVQRQYYTATDVKIAPEGGVVAVFHHPNDLVRINAQGEITQRINYSAATARTGESTDLFLPHVAVDGAGNAYVLEHYGSVVFKYSPDGQFVNRFGSEGLEPGQLHMALGIAVDGKGRVYVSDQRGIEVFDSEGRYLALIVIPGEGSVFGMVFNDIDEFFAAADTRVLKFKLREQGLSR